MVSLAVLNRIAIVQSAPVSIVAVSVVGDRFALAEFGRASFVGTVQGIVTQVIHGEGNALSADALVEEASSIGSIAHLGNGQASLNDVAEVVHARIDFLSIRRALRVVGFVYALSEILIAAVDSASNVVRAPFGHGFVLASGVGIASVISAPDLIVTNDVFGLASFELVAPDVKAEVASFSSFGLAVVVVGCVDTSSKVFVALILSARDVIVAIGGFVSASSGFFVAKVISAEDSVTAVLGKVEATRSFVEDSFVPLSEVVLLAAIDGARLVVIAVVVLRDVEALLNMTSVNSNMVISASPSVVANDDSVIVGIDVKRSDGRLSDELFSITNGILRLEVQHDNRIVLDVARVDDLVRGVNYGVEGNQSIGRVRSKLNLGGNSRVSEVVNRSSNGSVGFVEGSRQTVGGDQVLIELRSNPFLLENVSTRVGGDSSESTSVVSHKVVVHLPSKDEGKRVRSGILDFSSEQDSSISERRSNELVGDLDVETLGFVTGSEVCNVSVGKITRVNRGDCQNMQIFIVQEIQVVFISVGLTSSVGVNREEDGVG